MPLLETVLVAALSSATVVELGRLESLMAGSSTARRLLAETSGVRRGEASGEAVRWHREKNVLLFDSRKLKRLTEFEAQLAFSRELARASIGLPLEVVEAEMAAYQEELAVAVELSEPRLKRAVKVMEKTVASLRSSHRWQRERLGLNADRSVPLDLPGNEVDRIAYLLVLFRIDPMEMYWAVEKGRPWTDAAVRAAELEDFLTLHAGQRLPVAGEDVPYIRINGRRYRPGLVAAARRLQELGGLARLRESLGSFETRPIDELRAKVNAWSRH
jgi:hypothetical protein